jgi:hypothetical protein
MTIGGVHNIFPPSRELSVNFNWVDVASGTGYAIYYGCANADGTTYSLLPSAVGSALANLGVTKQTDFPELNRGGEKVIDYDFDLTEMQIPQSVKGKVLVNTTFTFVYGGGGGSGYFKAYFRKWDGASETEIVSGTSKNFTFAADTNNPQGILMILEAPLTLFKKGEQIRITIEVYLSGGNSRGTYWYDMLNTDYYKRMSVAIPYTLNL